jgi:hypothetical protein
MGSLPLRCCCQNVYVFTAEDAEFTEKNLKNLCELGALCGKFPYQHSTGVLSQNENEN